MYVECRLNIHADGVLGAAEKVLRKVLGLNVDLKGLNISEGVDRGVILRKHR